MLPKISIITPSLNQGSYIEQTIQSVFEQNYANLEYIIIDGGSSDNTIDIVKKYENRLAYWISEADEGQPDAINKGIERATGEILAYLNSDDLYLPGALAAVGQFFQEHTSSKWVCGDTLLFGEDHKTELVRTNVPKSIGHCLSWAYKAPQPGMFWKRELLHDGFDNKWRFCFDHELYVRLLCGGYHCEYLPIPLAAYRLHSSSKTVAEGDLFGREFDEIAKIYEPELSGPVRRWSAATRFLRESFDASSKGNRTRALERLMRAMLLHPQALVHRPFWGCLKGMVTGPPSEKLD
jgi:glycosyltransferase involved in cell wall biosynthesis